MNAESPAHSPALGPDELDELDRVANQIAVPLAHADELYALRDNIDTVRQRVLVQRSEGA